MQNRDNFLLQKSYLFSLVIHYVIFSTTLFSICWILWTTCQQISKDLAWKLVAKNTLAVQQSIRSELGTQDRIPNIWKECMKNILLKSVTKAAEKYFRKRLRRQQRNMPALPAIVISDDSDDVEILIWRSWCLPSLSRCPFDSGFLLIFTHLFHQTSSVNYKELCAEVPLRACRAQDMKWNEMINHRTK